MTSNQDTDFDKLFYKVATNKFSIDYLEEVQSFCSQLSDKKNVDEIKFKTENLISAIYFMNGMDDKSLRIDLALLQSSSPYLNSYIVILRALKTSEELGKTDDVVAYALHFLNDQQDNWSCKLPLLAWYVKFYLNEYGGSFSNYEQLLSSITERMEVKVDNSKPFIERVDYVYCEFKRGSKDVHDFHLAYARSKPEQKDKLLDDYLRTEKVGFFSTQIIECYSSSSSSSSSGSGT